MRHLENSIPLTKEIWEAKREYMSLDIETVSLENRLPLGIAVGISGTAGFYFFDINDEILRTMVKNSDKLIIHNVKFDLPLLAHYGFQINGYEDTEILALSNGYAPLNLPHLSKVLLQRECPSVTLQWENTKQGNIGIDHEIMGYMSIIHAINTFALWESLPKLPLYYLIDKPTIELTLEMEKWGVYVNQYMLTQLEQETVRKLDVLETYLRKELPDVKNLNSRPQLAAGLKKRGVIGTRKTKGGADAVSKESLAPLKHPIANAVLNYQSVKKTITTYVPAFRKTDVNGRMHTNFGFTETGRWKSSKPNLQNLTGDGKFEDEDGE
jgi:DNA polymerase I-like protein with 3'-5' exonuclease and polymerase domains